MKLQILFVQLVIFLSVQFLEGLKDCPDNRSYKFVVKQLLAGLGNRRRQLVSWSINCPVASVEEVFDGSVIVHKRYTCCKNCEKLFTECQGKALEFICKSRALECICRCRAYSIEGLKTNAGIPGSNSISPPRRKRMVGEDLFRIKLSRNFQPKPDSETNERKKVTTCFKMDCSKGTCCRRQYCTKIMSERNSIMA